MCIASSTHLSAMPIDRTPWTDKTVMPWGDHHGQRMGNVPASYLDWLRDQPWIPTWYGLHAYLELNKTRIDKELEDEAPTYGDADDGFDSYEDYKRNG